MVLLKIVTKNFKTLLFSVKVIPDFHRIPPDILLKSLVLVTNQLDTIISKATEIVDLDPEFFLLREDPGSEHKKLILAMLQILNVSSKLVYEHVPGPTKPAPVFGLI